MVAKLVKAKMVAKIRIIAAEAVGAVAAVVVSEVGVEAIQKAAIAHRVHLPRTTLP